MRNRGVYIIIVIGVLEKLKRTFILMSRLMIL